MRKKGADAGCVESRLARASRLRQPHPHSRRSPNLVGSTAEEWCRYDIMLTHSTDHRYHQWVHILWTHVKYEVLKAKGVYEADRTAGSSKYFKKLETSADFGPEETDYKMVNTRALMMIDLALGLSKDLPRLNSEMELSETDAETPLTVPKRILCQVRGPGMIGSRIYAPVGGRSDLC